MVRWVGAEILLECRVQIVGEPRLRSGPLQVAARFVDVERWYPRHVSRNHRVEHHRETGWIGFAPEVSRPAKSVGFVVVVVCRRESLNALGIRGVRNAIPVLDARRAEVD